MEEETRKLREAEEIRELRRQLEEKERELIRQKLEIEEKNVCQFDRMFGVTRAKPFFLFSYDKTQELLGLKHENLHNFP